MNGRSLSIVIVSATVLAPMAISASLKLNDDSTFTDLTLTGAGQLHSTSTVTLNGQSTLGGNFYGRNLTCLFDCEVQLTGDSNISGLRVRDYARLVTQSTATLDSGSLSLVTGGSVINNGVLTIDGASILGGDHSLVNGGSITIDGP